MVTTAPRTEIGSVDSVPAWGSFLTVTQDPTEPTVWAGQQRVATVNRMRVDAQVDSLCSSLVMPIMRMKWELNPNGARDEVVEQISTDLGIPIKGSVDAPARRSRRRFKHRDHLEHALLALWYGHMFFEQVPDTENFDLATDGWRLRKLAPRMPASIDTIHTARDGGLRGITQVGWAGSVAPKARRGLALAAISEPQIPVGSLAAYVWKREGSNWSGRSMLRPLYRDWVLKDRALRVDSIKNERFGMGIPTATAPIGGDPTQYAKLAQSIRASENGGVGLDNGATVGVEGIRGTLPDVMASIRYYDESMARSFMAMVIQLGQTQTGSRALGETFADFFQMLVEAVANWYADTTNEHVIEDMVDWNFGEDEPAPLIEWSYPQGEQMLAITELTQMVQAGVITMDRQTEQALRQRTRLPMLPEVEDVPDVESAATSPFASVGLPALVQGGIISPQEARDLLGMTGPAPTPSQVEAFLASKGMTTAAIKAALAKPTVGHRAMSSAEVAAGTDFQVLQDAWLEATGDLVSEWRTKVQSAQIDELVEQVRKAVAANDLVALSNLKATVGGTELLLDNLKALAEDAIVGAKEEALSQGVKIGTINTTKNVEPLLAQRAEATANLLAQGIADSASRKALNLGVTLAPADVAAAVREHLEGLSDAYLQDMLGGAMTQAQNTGRKEVFAERPCRIYASELLDANTCSVCSAIDGQEFGSLAEAEKEYPTGGHKGCLGGPRCRGTLVAVYEEGDNKLPPEPDPVPEPVVDPTPDPEAQVAALMDYHTNSFALNSELRAGVETNPLVPGLDALMSSSELAKKAKVYRVVDNPALHSQMLAKTKAPGAKVGKWVADPDRGKFASQQVTKGKLGVINDKAYLSTTTDKAILEDFQQGSLRERVTFEIDAPAGTRGVRLADVLSDDDHYYEQGEILLDRGTSLDITEIIERNDGSITVKAKVVPDSSVNSAIMPEPTPGVSLEQSFTDSEALLKGTPEGASVANYTGLSHDAINQVLRAPYDHKLTPEDIAQQLGGADLKTTIADMDKAFEVGGVTLDEPVTLYRGIGKSYAKDLDVGELRTDLGFMSVSYDESIASWHATNNKGGVNMVVRVPSGKTVIAGSKDESELIFPRNTRFKVVSKTKTEIVVEVL